MNAHWKMSKKSNYPRRERGTEIIYGFALDFWTAAHEARMSGRIPAPSAGYPVDTPPTPDAHVTISNKNSLFFFPYTFYIFRCALCTHTHTRDTRTETIHCSIIGPTISTWYRILFMKRTANEKLYNLLIIIIFPARAQLLVNCSLQ